MTTPSPQTSEAIPVQRQAARLDGRWQRWLPTPGNMVFTLLVVGALFWATAAGAFPLKTPEAPGASTNTVAYQGRLADSSGSPLTGVYEMRFRLYNLASGGAALWTEQWTGANAIQVSAGLFNVMLGSLTPIPQSVVTGNNSLWLGVTVGTDTEMVPRVQLGSVPFATQALTVPDGAVTRSKIADGAVTRSKLSSPVLATNSPSLGETEDLELGPALTLPYAGFKHTITTTVASQIVLVASGTFFQWAGPSTELYTSMRRNGVHLMTKYMNTVPVMSNWSWNLVDDVPPGTHTYQLYVFATQPGVMARWMVPTITLIVIPKE